MLKKIIESIFKKKNNRIFRKILKIANKVNQMESTIKKLSDKQLSKKTTEFRDLLNKGANLNDILSESFAVVREASKRIFGMRHFDVQIIGGIALNAGYITEMRTGEGKTLTATLPAYLNALIGKGVHIVTVNDYLAKRDAENNRPLFEFLGLKIGINLSGLSKSEKYAAYSADITYGTNNEYCFDYLRDNMVYHLEDKIQRKLYYALIDEVDSILIDEARTPLIISGQSEDNSDLYRKINQLVLQLLYKHKRPFEHFLIDEQSRQVHLTERGLITIEDLLLKNYIIKSGESLYSSNNVILMHYVIASLRAHTLFSRDVDYIVKKGEVMIVDEHTGRVMPGRRWSDGLHQAMEAKENVSIQYENQILASITFQNYFRLYEKLSGMTGTANTEAFEFKSIYKLNTVVIPTNRPMIRKDFSDLIYMTEKEKIQAIIKDIKIRTKIGQPVLVGTISIEKSELISSALKKAGIRHNILNAKRHDMEAEIIAQAGKPSAVTIATNMAGRGTDIILGGNWKSEINLKKLYTKKEINEIKSGWKKRHEIVLSAGGLHIIGTERHESRRIDNQLRGRSGRQGDIGSSQFYLSMEDHLMRIFATDKIINVMKKLGMKSGESIEHPWLTKAIANAQKRVESRNFDIRKQLLEYDDIINDQRQIFYNQRNELLITNDISSIINTIRTEVIKKIVDTYILTQCLEKKHNLINLEKRIKNEFCIDISINTWICNNQVNKINKKEILSYILSLMKKKYYEKEKFLGKKIMRNFEKCFMLKTLDLFWKEHLIAMDYLRQGIHLRGYAQKDPKQEYKKESFLMFTNMLNTIKSEIIIGLSKFTVNNIKKIIKIEKNKIIRI